MTVPLDKSGCPDLQALVERAGRRYAASIGEVYVEDVLDEKGNLKRPAHQGGYQHITPEEWAEYDRAMAAPGSTEAAADGQAVPDPRALSHGPDPQIERMYAAQGGRLGCEQPPLVVKNGKYVPYDEEPR